MTKFLLAALLTLSTLQALAEDAKQTVQCSVKPEEYANNQFEAQKLPAFPVRIVSSTATDLMGRIEGGTFNVHKNYQIRISGYLNKPGSVWIEGGTMMLLSVDLLKVDDSGKTSVLASSSFMSGKIFNPKQLEKVQAGDVWISESLTSLDYILAKNQGEVPKDLLTSVGFSCEVVR